ncbi:MarR family winged helix-turn-helix transcriptional regulator [Bacillus sp. 03113]|uniref:MarR family winged helix-turn-helix transcriptional regulator n=1 Tax=Bacillus sp. 03113 TaxID=2578211 RepID=UPI0011413431|nr:MarR family transcriptional regulator [Bacillus sp. 03113]
MRAIDKLRYLIQCVQREGNNRFSTLLIENGLDITPSQSEVITVLAEFGPMSIAELGDLLLCNAQHPSRLVARLLDKKFIDKEISQDDNRKVIISLTPEGKELTTQIRRIEQIFNNEIQEKMSALENFTVNDLNLLLSEHIKETVSEKKIARRFEDNN